MGTHLGLMSSPRLPLLRFAAVHVRQVERHQGGEDGAQAAGGGDGDRGGRWRARARGRAAAATLTGGGAGSLFGKHLGKGMGVCTRVFMKGLGMGSRFLLPFPCLAYDGNWRGIKLSSRINKVPPGKKSVGIGFPNSQSPSHLNSHSL